MKSMKSSCKGIKSMLLIAFLAISFSSTVFAAPPPAALIAKQIGTIPANTKITGVTGDDDGNVYAIVSNGTIIYKIAPDETTTVWASGLQQVFNANDLQYADGYIYSNKYTKKLYRSPLSNPTAETTQGTLPSGIYYPVAYYNNKIYTCVWINQGSFVYASSIYEIDIATGSTSLYLDGSDGVPAKVMGMTFGSNGHLYVTTYNGGEVYEYDGSSFSLKLTGLGIVNDIEQDSDGKFYVAVKNVGVKRYNSDFTFDTDLPEGTAINDWRLGLTQGKIVFAKHNTNQVYILEPPVEDIPISLWAIVIGLGLIGIYTFFKSRKRVTA